MSQKLNGLIATWYRDWFRTDQLYSQWARKYGLTYNALFAVYELYHLQCCTPSHLVEFLSISKQTVNSILDRLEKQGLVVREPSLEDRRSCSVALSEEGRLWAGKLLSELANVEQRAFTRLQDQNVEDLVHLGGTLADYLQDEMGKGEDHGADQ